MFLSVVNFFSHVWFFCCSLIFVRVCCFDLVSVEYLLWERLHVKLMSCVKRWLKSQNEQRKMVIIIAFGECFFWFCILLLAVAIFFFFWFGAVRTNVVTYVSWHNRHLYNLHLVRRRNACFYFNATLFAISCSILFFSRRSVDIENFYSLYIVFGGCCCCRRCFV